MKNILFCLSIFLLSASSYAAPTDILATYKGGKVTEQEVMTRFGADLEKAPQTQGKKFTELDKNFQEMLVKNYINELLILEEVKKHDITESSELKEKFELAKQQIIAQSLITKYIEQAVTESAIKKEYADYVKSLKGKKEVKTRHILFANEADAKKAKVELDKSQDKNKKFAELVVKYSQDPGSKQNKGEIGYVMRGQLAPEYESKAFAMKKNEISEPVKSKFGWHIIQVLDQRTVKIPTAAEMQESIKNKLSNEAMKKYIDSLEKKAEVKIKLN